MTNSDDEEVRMTITVPASLRSLVKLRAALNDRSFSGELVHCLKRGAEWSGNLEMIREARAVFGEKAADQLAIKLAAGAEVGADTPAAGNENAALERGGL